MEQKKKQKHGWLLAIAGCCMVLVCIITIVILQKDTLTIDTAVYNWLMTWESDTMTYIAKAFTMLGSAAVLITIAALALLGKDRKLGMLISLNLIFITLANQLLKHIIQRPRPNEDFHLVEGHGFSFPSGHSMVSMAFYGLLMYIACAKIQNRYARYGICIGLGFVICMIGLSRIYLGVHYVTDVAGGFLISIAYLIGITSLITYMKKSEEQKQ